MNNRESFKIKGDSRMFQNWNLLHPLTLPPVVQKVMHHLSNRDLMTSRLVCKEWNSRACVTLRKSKTLKFTSQTKLLDEYTELIGRSVDLPYANYELEFYDMSDPVVNNFIDICGKSTTSLQLNNCRCTGIKLWEILTKLQSTLSKFSINCDPIEYPPNGISPQLIPFLQNLQSLSLFGEFSKNLQLIRDLIKSALNLTSLHFKCFDPLAQDSPFEKLCLQVFLESSLNLTKLQNFAMESRISDIDLLNFRKKNYTKLKHIHLNLNSDVRPFTLFLLLQDLSNSLIKLELEFSFFEEKSDNSVPEEEIPEENETEPIAAKIQRLHNRNDPNVVTTSLVQKLKKYKEFRLPRLQNLQRLSLTNFQGSLDFLNECQNLKYLFLINCDLAVPTLNSVQIHSNLSCFMSTTLLDGTICRNLAQIFPNLKTLKVNVNNEVLKTIFEVMTKLQELILSGQSLTDQGITGMSLDVYKMVWDRVSPDVPYIGNLKDLRKLWIHNAGFITDSSVVYGIVSCLNLTELSLLNAEVTDTSLFAIGNKLRNLRKLEILSNVPQLTAGGKAYIRQQLPNCDFILGQTDIMNLYRPQRNVGSEIGSTSPMEILLGLFC